MDVTAWLKRLGLGHYTEAFAENGITADFLPELTNEDLKDLGVSRLADRKRLLRAIADRGDGTVCVAFWRKTDLQQADLGGPVAAALSTLVAIRPFTTLVSVDVIEFRRPAVV